MTVAALIPWREPANDPGRRRWRAREAVVQHLRRILGGCRILIVDTTSGGFSRAAAIHRGLTEIDVDIAIVTDGDLICPRLNDAVQIAEAGGWAAPYTTVRRLSSPETDGWYQGATPASWIRGVREVPCGGTLVAPVQTLLEVPPDHRFVGHGGEEHAWGAAMDTLVGAAAELDGVALHLWHPRAASGGPANDALLARYRAAAGDRTAMRGILDEIGAPPAGFDLRWL